MGLEYVLDLKIGLKSIILKVMPSFIFYKKIHLWLEKLNSGCKIYDIPKIIALKGQSYLIVQKCCKCQNLFVFVALQIWTHKSQIQMHKSLKFQICKNKHTNDNPQILIQKIRKCLFAKTNFFYWLLFFIIVSIMTLIADFR